MVAGLTKIHFTKPTPVQEQVIPILLKGQDAIVQSQTGSGKTHAFLLPFFSQLKANQDLPQLVITSPSRELANQTYELAKQLLEASDETFRMHLYVGGSDKERQIENLSQQQPDIVIVALGAPKQELLIHRYYRRGEKGVFIGVGGSFDVLSGRKKRAPSFFIRHNLEWLYRIASEPKRLKRFWDSNIKFLFELRKEKHGNR